MLILTQRYDQPLTHVWCYVTFMQVSLLITWLVYDIVMLPYWLQYCLIWYLTGIPAGEPSTSPRIPGGFMGEIQGIILAENFLMISLRKFKGKEGEFSMWIFPPPFPVESLGIFPGGNFPRASLKNFKMQFIDIGRVPVVWKYPTDDLMSFFCELKC